MIKLRQSWIFVKKKYDLGTELEARFKELETAEAEYIEQSERKSEIDSKKKS